MANNFDGQIDYLEQFGSTSVSPLSSLQIKFFILLSRSKWSQMFSFRLSAVQGVCIEKTVPVPQIRPPAEGEPQEVWRLRRSLSCHPCCSHCLRLTVCHVSVPTLLSLDGSSELVLVLTLVTTNTDSPVTLDL